MGPSALMAVASREDIVFDITNTPQALHSTKNRFLWDLRS